MGTPIRFLYQERMGIADQNYVQGIIHDYRETLNWTITEENGMSRDKCFPPYVVVSDMNSRGGSLRLADLRDIVLESEM